MATSEELLELFHLNPVDSTAPYRWDDEVVFAWLSEAQREACLRGGLLKDASTASICEISVVAGTTTYSVSPLVVKIDRAMLLSESGILARVDIFDHEEMDRSFPEWRTTADTPNGCILEGNTLTLNRIPIEDATVKLEVFRLPLANISSTVQPEIPSIHHDELINWPLYRAHQIEDDDEERPVGRWQKYYARFEAYFGRKPSADLKRKQSTNTPHRVKAWW